MDRIIVKLHVLNWTMGEVAFFDITLSGDGELEVSWGDSKVSHYRPRYKGEKIRVEHDYGKNAKIDEQHFVVNIECKGATIRTFYTGCMDMEIDDIDFSCALSIESLSMSWLSNNSQLSKITISPNHNIKPKSWEYVQRIIEKNHGEIIFL